MHVLTAVVVVQDLHGGGKEGVDLIPDPLGPIANHAQADLIPGINPASFTRFRAAPTSLSLAT